MITFSEADLEQATLEWLEELGFITIKGHEIGPDGICPERKSHSDVVLTEILRDKLTLINPHIPLEAIEDAIRQVIVTSHPSLIVNNQSFHKFITDGIDVSVRDNKGTTFYDKVQLFDQINLENNNWLAVSQLTVIEGKNEKRPDIVVCKWHTFSSY